MLMVEKVKDWLVIIGLSHKRMLEQFLNVWPLVGILNKTLSQEVVKLFGPS